MENFSAIAYKPTDDEFVIEISIVLSNKELIMLKKDPIVSGYENFIPE